MGWMKCVLWALARSFEECRIKDVQFTRVKHERFWRIVSHDCCHTQQTLWYSNLIDSLLCCSQSRTLPVVDQAASPLGLLENPMCWSSPACSHSPLSALELRGELLTQTWTDRLVKNALHVQFWGVTTVSKCSDSLWNTNHWICNLVASVVF